jgi:hypothetical protein
MEKTIRVVKMAILKVEEIGSERFLKKLFREKLI